jgi:hypothetical protein
VYKHPVVPPKSLGSPATTRSVKTDISFAKHLEIVKSTYKMAPTTSVSTPLPADCTPEQAIRALHNHEIYIKATCPQLISHKLISGTPNIGEACVYEVTDKKPIGQTTFKLTLTNVADGIDTLVNAKPPIGTLTINGTWRVADGVLKEEVVIEANMLMKKMAKGNVEKSHPEQHAALLAEATKV